MDRQASEAFLAWTADGRVTSASGACEEALEITAEALLGKRIWEVLDVEARPLQALYARAELGPMVDFVPRGNHDPRTYLRFAAERHGGEVHASVVNLSHLLHGAPPIQISRLSSSLSHELRNPLSSVKLAVQTLARNPDHSDRDKRRLSIAHREIRTMERMLWMLSEYGRDTPPRLENVALRSLLQQSAEMVDPELVERQMTLAVDEAADVPQVQADLARVRPVLAQLLLNVATGLEPPGAVKVSLKRASNGDGLMCIEDPSSQLLPAERPTLFEPFGSKLARGAGLSLAALRQVMLQKGGDVTAEAHPVQGTVFSLQFPAARH